MAIEGPLRELGIHDVFQLLDLSRKTGTLRVVSALRDNEGMVAFDRGKIVHAEIHSNPHPLGQMLLRAGKLTEGDLSRARALQSEGRDHRKLGGILVSIGAISQRELDRQVRLQIEAVVFELMSWREGNFSFVEGNVSHLNVDVAASISSESLLMEGARRIDEWSRIADKVPNLSVVAMLAPVTAEHAGLLDLLPNEWAVLSTIDGVRDIRGLATTLAQSDFDVAKVVYGLLSTGVIELKKPDRQAEKVALPMGDPAAYVAEARRATTEGRLDAALDAARQGVLADGASGAAHLALAEVMLRMGRVKDAIDALRTAADADPLNADVQRMRGIAAAARGDFDDAVNAWGKFLAMAPTHPDAPRIRAGVEAVARLRAMVESATNG
jgi:tetratricopeptide (TPR) repeat protein